MSDPKEEQKRLTDEDVAWRPRWQCSGCRIYFHGPHQKTCPKCGRVGYWTGSFVWPPAQPQATEPPKPEASQCPTCEGSGLVWPHQVGDYVTGQQYVCPNCGGSGRVDKETPADAPTPAQPQAAVPILGTLLTDLSSLADPCSGIRLAQRRLIGRAAEMLQTLARHAHQLQAALDKEKLRGDIQQQMLDVRNGLLQTYHEIDEQLKCQRDEKTQEILRLKAKLYDAWAQEGHLIREVTREAEVRRDWQKKAMDAEADAARNLAQELREKLRKADVEVGRLMTQTEQQANIICACEDLLPLRDATSNTTRPIQEELREYIGSLWAKIDRLKGELTAYEAGRKPTEKGSDEV